MGCDIHLHVEVKVKGEWHNYSHPHVYRDYALFAKMGDVRNYGDTDIKPLSKNRGLPSNVSKIVFFLHEKWDSDAHSTSWLDSEEVTTLCMWMQKFKRDACEVFGYLDGSGFDSFYKYSEENSFDDFRFVFWFDN